MDQSINALVETWIIIKQEPWCAGHTGQCLSQDQRELQLLLKLLRSRQSSNLKTLAVSLDYVVS